MSDEARPLEMTHDERSQVFTAVVDGATCEVNYSLQGKTMVITHTGVPQSVGGRGIAAAMTKFAVEIAQAKGWKVDPACSYAEAWFRRNPEYSHLLA